MPTKARTRQPAPAERQQPAPAERRTRPRAARRTAKVDLPFVTAEFHLPELHMPELHLPTVGRDEVTAAARSLVPSARQAAYYGGLVVLAALEVIEWPVAAVIGVGAAVLGRRNAHDEPKEGQARVPAPRQQ